MSDRLTVGRNLVREPRGGRTRGRPSVRIIRLNDKLGVDVDVGDQPAGQPSRTKPQGQNEKGASMCRSSPFRSTVCTCYIRGLDMCKVLSKQSIPSHFEHELHYRFGYM